MIRVFLKRMKLVGSKALNDGSISKKIEVRIKISSWMMGAYLKNSKKTIFLKAGKYIKSHNVIVNLTSF